MTAHAQLNTALTIAGSDSGGGAGIQADLQTFGSLGVHGCSVVTCVTAQNPYGVTGVQPIAPGIVRRQLEAVFSELHPAACKTGMLFSAGIIDVVVEFFQTRPRPHLPLIVDPVMIATSGSRLLKPVAIRTLKSRLLPIATLTTPNLDEAQALTGLRITDPEGLRAAARQIHDEFGCAVLVKGGHLKRLNEAIDLFYDGSTEILLSAPYVRNVSTHGTGCTYSAAITAWSAQGCPLATAIARAKNFISNAILNSNRVGKHSVLNWTQFPAKRTATND